MTYFANRRTKTQVKDFTVTQQSHVLFLDKNINQFTELLCFIWAHFITWYFLFFFTCDLDDNCILEFVDEDINKAFNFSTLVGAERKGKGLTSTWLPDHPSAKSPSEQCDACKVISKRFKCTTVDTHTLRHT